jgi:hypothetical protein
MEGRVNAGVVVSDNLGVEWPPLRRQRPSVYPARGERTGPIEAERRYAAAVGGVLVVARQRPRRGWTTLAPGLAPGPGPISHWAQGPVLVP